MGALPVTLPAVSRPGIAMVGKSFGWRVTATAAAVVAAGWVLAGGLIMVL